MLDRIERLFDGAFRDMAGGLELLVDKLRQLVVLGRVGGVIVVERHAEVGEVARVLGVHTFDELLGRDAFLRGTQHHRRAVGVVGADVMAFVPAQFLEPHPDVGLDVLHQMPEMDRAVGVGQGAGDEDFSFVLGHDALIAGRAGLCV